MTAAQDGDDSLSATTRMELRRLAWKYLRRRGDVDMDTVELLAWQRLETEVLEAHADWLHRTKTAVEALGHPWTVDELNAYLDAEDGDGC